MLARVLYEQPFLAGFVDWYAARGVECVLLVRDGLDDAGDVAALPPVAVARLALVVGKIVDCWPPPDSDKLFCEKIDCGDAFGGARAEIERWLAEVNEQASSLGSSVAGGIQAAGADVTNRLNALITLLERVNQKPPEETEEEIVITTVTRQRRRRGNEYIETGMKSARQTTAPDVDNIDLTAVCLLYTSPSPRDRG